MFVEIEDENAQIAGVIHAVDQLEPRRRAMFLLHLANELTLAARNTYGAACDEVEAPKDLRLYNELQHRVLANLRDITQGSDERISCAEIIAEASHQLFPIVTACRRALELVNLLS